MLTRYEILTELRRVGVEEPCLLKAYLRDFENYIDTNYGLKIVKTKKKMEGSDCRNPSPATWMTFPMTGNSLGMRRRMNDSIARLPEPA